MNRASTTFTLWQRGFFLAKTKSIGSALTQCLVVEMFQEMKKMKFILVKLLTEDQFEMFDIFINFLLHFL